MSTYANPAKALLWLDGDAFRAPAGTAVPADIFASSLAGWEAFGGVQAGFVVERTQQRTPFSVWNAEGVYRMKKGDEEPAIRLRPVDLSKATALTLLTGGSITAAAGGYRWDEGNEEFFALIVRVLDGTAKMGYHMRKAELGNRPTETLNDEQLMGWDMEIVPLVPDGGGKPIERYTFTNPLA